MGKTRPPNPPGFRYQIVELVRAGRTPDELSREFVPPAQTIRNWDLDEGRRLDNLTTDERGELRCLRRENRQLRLELEILKHHTHHAPHSRSGHTALTRLEL